MVAANGVLTIKVDKLRVVHPTYTHIAWGGKPRNVFHRGYPGYMLELQRD